MDILSKSWVEKYRPKNIDELIIPADTKAKIKSFIDSESVPNMLFFSPTPGTGKTSTALAIAATLDFDVLMINGSNEGRLIETLRTKVVNFASVMSIAGKKKCIIIDEADYMPEESIQPALRNMIEDFNKIGVVFIFTCNNVDRIIDPIKSRCALIDFSVRKENAKELKFALLERVAQILKAENIKIENESILPALIKLYFPDNRRLLNELQLATSDGILNTTALSPQLTGDSLVDLVDIVKQRKLKSMREWVGQNPNISIQTINRYFYDNAYDIFEAQSISDFILIAGNWNYKSSFSTDKEIAITANLTEIMSTCTFTE